VVNRIKEETEYQTCPSCELLGGFSLPDALLEPCQECGTTSMWLGTAIGRIAATEEQLQEYANGKAR
jgi:hypothetical protein